MKKINLIEWLSRNSHEKQSPQRFVRYAAMLIMLLTLGVGQMWATSGTITVYFKNTPGWTNVYVYFYSGAYWDNTNGSGSASGGSFQSGPNKMTYDSTLKLYKYTYTGTYSGVVSFTKDSQSNYGNFYNTEAAYRGDYSTSSPIYVPSSTSNETKNGTKYYNTGQWVGTTKRTLYFVNKDSWATPNAYVWNTYSDHVSWSGETMSSTGQTYGGKTIYKYTTQYDFASVKFSNNGSSETSNQTLGSTNDGKMYNNGSWIAAQYDIDFDEEGATTSGSYPSYATVGSTMPTITTAPSKTGYDFGGYYDGDNGTGTKYWNANRTGAQTCAIDGPNQFYAKWTAKQTTVTLSANAPAGETVTNGGTTVTATYDAALPAFSALTCTGGYALKGYYTNTSGGTKVINADGSFAANSGIWNRTDGATLTLHAQWSLDRTLTYDGNTNTSGNVPAAATTYANGTNVTVLGNVAGSPLVKTGYTFTGWNTSADGNGVAYAAGSTITMNANYTLYAQWQENMTTVNLVASPAGGGTFTVGGAAATSTTAGVTTTRSVAAVPYPGYRTSATVWSKDNNYISWSSATTNPTTITGDGSNGNSTTLTGNFTQTYAYLQGRMTIYTTIGRSVKKHIGDTEGKWDDSSNRMKMDYDGTNHRFYLHTYRTPVELSTAQTDGEQYFFFKTSTSSSTLANTQTYRPAEGRTLTARGTGNKKATETSSGTNSIWFDDNSTSNGYAIIYFDEAGVWYDVEHSLIYNNNGGSGAVTATACYLHGTNATAAGVGSMSKSNYTFGGWNTTQYITGTSYAASASVTMNSNTTLYAKWTRSVTLDRNTATTGSTSVTATYNCATLPSITNPSKDGYTFGGWYTANDGSGSQVINTSGALQSGVSNWTTSTRFTRTADGATLYAKWTQTVTLNANTDNHGSGTNKTATIVLNATDKSSITHCTAATGYHLVGYYTAATDGTKILNADGSFAGSNITVSTVEYISSGKWVKAGATTLYAQYEPTNYTVTLTPGIGGSGSGTMTIDYDAAAYKTFSHSITQTGYSISGWYASSTKVLNANGTFAASTVSGYITSDKWTKAANCELAAWWTPNPYAVTFDATTNGGELVGSSPKDVIFAETSISSCPTANKEGYIFDGWYTKASGGKKVINTNGSLVANVTDGSQYTDGSSKWRLPSATTVYAVYVAPTTLIEQPARIAGKRVPIDTLDAKNHPEIDSVIVHHSISPTPYGNTNISYELCYSNHVPLDVQPKIQYGTGAGVGYDTVWMPMEEIQMYELVAYLRTGSTRGEGDLVTTDTALVSVEKTWPVKVRYIMDGVDLRDATEWPVYPSLRTTEIRIPEERNGYALDHLDYGVGITVDSSKTVSYGIAGDMYCTYVKTANAATITAHYKVAPNTVYFFDAFEDRWYTPYIFDYGTTGYWGTGDDTGKGAGAEGHLGTRATSVDFMDRMYMMPIGSTTTKLAIGSDEQKKEDGTGFKYFYSRTYTPEGWVEPLTVTPQIFYRTDFDHALSMFVPVAKSSSDYYVENDKARYFRGFWVRYSPDRDSTGYFLKVYDRIAVDGGKLVQSIPMRLTQTGENDTWELTATMDLEGGHTYGFKYIKVTESDTLWYGDPNTMTSTNHTDWWLKTGTNNCGLTTTSAGDYTFHLHCVNYGDKAANAANDSEVQGKMVMTVDYATLDGDFRVVYQDDAQTNLTVGKSNVEPIASQSMRARANGQDTVTFYIRKDATGRSMKFQKFNGSTGAWDDVAGGTIALTNTADQTFTVSKDTTYQIYLQQTADGKAIEATGMDYYSGSYYIRTDCVDEHKWDYKQTLDAHRMVESDYATHLTTDPFTHYYVHWVDGSKNVKFVVATKYSPCLTDTLITDNYANVAGGNLPSAGASVRFMYNKKTNTIKRAYLAGAQGGLLDTDFLKLTESSSSKMKNMSGSAITEITFTDLGNFAYQAEIQAQPGLTGKLTAKYNNQTQYFKGSAESSETILGGTGSSWQHIIMTYDFKTNRLICAWTPGDTINETMSINADVMIIRRGKNDAEQIVFKTNGTELQDVKYIYGVIQLDYNDLVGRMYSWDWWAYEHCMYYISFPFDVLVSDITGVGTIGQDWRIQRYNGALRAEKGWFEQDGITTWWEDVQAGDTLHAYEGYSLLLARTRFNDSSNPIWKNKSYGDKVYLFFPSLNATTGIISNGEVTFTVPAHECNIERPFLNPYGEYVSHRISDSHWNMLGMPLFENQTAFSIEAGPTYDREDYGTKTLQYLYAWNSAGNTLGIQLTLDEDWEFKTMYSYMVQYTGKVTFKGSTINKIVAAKREEEKKNYHVKLELSRDEQFIGRTYVELRENAVDSFLLNEDVYMVQNGVNADLYTVAGGCAAAANVLPIADQTVQVGLSVKQAGTYVFSMPNTFDGEVILVDTYHQTRTNLAIDDYEIALPTGEITDRFLLEINIHKTPTAIDGTEGDGSFKDGKAHKFIMNDMMYILNDGVLYDATGKRVK